MRRSLLAFLPLLFAGCFHTSYLAQAGSGQLELLRSSRPISSVLRQGDAPLNVRRVLSHVTRIKSFARSQGLMPSDSYERYADLKRGAAVWVVQASSPLAFEQREWCFPIVGTVPYLGFFDDAGARAFAEELARKERLDVDVRTASAYSTLGWLKDPVLSTMISDGPEALGELANVILHETVHATVYVGSQSAFNESLASFVADRMTLQWLEQALGPDALQTLAWKQYDAHGRARIERMHQAWGELDALYRSSKPDSEKREEKTRILERLKTQLGTTRALNNASLAGVKNYGTGLPGFERLFEACGQSWPAFLDAVRTIGAADFDREQAEAFEPVLDRVAASACAWSGRSRLPNADLARP